MVDRRAFLAGAGAAALTLAAGVPIGAAAEFDPADVIAELIDSGLSVYWSRPIGPDAPPAYYAVVPAIGLDYTRAQLDLMARWAKALTSCPIRAARMETFLAAFERGELGQG